MKYILFDGSAHLEVSETFFHLVAKALEGQSIPDEDIADGVFWLEVDKNAFKALRWCD